MVGSGTRILTNPLNQKRRVSINPLNKKMGLNTIIRVYVLAMREKPIIKHFITLFN